LEVANLEADLVVEKAKELKADKVQVEGNQVVTLFKPLTGKRSE